MESILIIDDEEMLREGLRLGLTAQGYRVLEAVDGMAGVDAARAEHPDIILCDVMMPNRNGYETLEVLRADPATSDIPVILMTGGAHTDSAIRDGMSMGADDYIAKPFAFKDLLGSVRSRLDNRRALRARAEKRVDRVRESIALSLPHELRTPLTAIKGYAEQLELESGQMDRATIAWCATNVREAAERLHAICENVLTVTQLELIASDPAAVARLREETTEDLHRLAGLLARQQAEREERSADLRTDLKPVNARISQESFDRMLHQVLGNAFKFSQPGSPVEVRVGPAPTGCAIAVTDRGRGIATDELPLLDSYIQLGRDQHEQQGLGLGLSIARRLAELHGGSLSLRSEPGQGTTVTILLLSAD